MLSISPSSVNLWSFSTPPRPQETCSRKEGLYTRIVLFRRYITCAYSRSVSMAWSCGSLPDMSIGLDGMTSLASWTIATGTKPEAESCRNIWVRKHARRSGRCKWRTSEHYLPVWWMHPGISGNILIGVPSLSNNIPILLNHLSSYIQDGGLDSIERGVWLRSQWHWQRIYWACYGRP